VPTVASLQIDGLACNADQIASSITVVGSTMCALKVPNSREVPIFQVFQNRQSVDGLIEEVSFEQGMTFG
jgi:hypothetical protein